MSEEHVAEGVVRDAVLVQEREPLPLVSTSEHPREDGSLFLVVRNGYKVETLPGPRAPKRVHVADDLDTFARWLSRKATPDTTELFIGTDRVAAVLDPGELEPEVPTCLLALAPELLAFQGVLGQELQLRGFHDLVRSFRRHLVDSDQHLAELRSVRVQGSEELDTQIDETGAVRVSGVVGRRDVSAKIPSELVLRTSFYQGLRSWTVDVELLVTVSLAPLTFTLTCPAWELFQVEARRQVRAQLEEDLAEGFTVALGVLGLGDRPEPRRRAE